MNKTQFQRKTEEKQRYKWLKIGFFNMNINAQQTIQVCIKTSSDLYNERTYNMFR